MHIAAMYFAVVNLVTWIAYWRDKRSAIQGGRRVPEVRLLTLAALGGTPAARAAQRFHRHKTMKQPYRMYLQRIIRWQIRLVAIGLSATVIMMSQAYMAAGR